MAAELCERQPIRGRAIADKEALARRLKRFAHEIADAPRPEILTIRCRGCVIRFFESAPGFRADSGGVVARELISGHDHAITVADSVLDTNGGQPRTA